MPLVATVKHSKEGARVMARFRKMQPVLAYAAAHLDEDVSLKALAREARLSTFHLQRIFSSVVGETPKRLTLRLRLGRAAVMLLAGEDSILDVALCCGFQSHEAFIRAFRRRFGVTPGTYRQRGFGNRVSAAEAKQYAALVAQVGPCIGLYHISEEPKSWRTDMTYAIVKLSRTDARLRADRGDTR
jgi:AraC family transcriptional regulator